MPYAIGIAQQRRHGKPTNSARYMADKAQNSETASKDWSIKDYWRTEDVAAYLGVGPQGARDFIRRNNIPRSPASNRFVAKADVIRALAQGRLPDDPARPRARRVVRSKSAQLTMPINPKAQNVPVETSLEP